MVDGEPVGDLVGLPDRPLVARSYSEDEMRAFANKPFWGVPELLGHLMISAVSIVMHALCLALTMNVSGVIALREFLGLVNEVCSKVVQCFHL
jgi:hypothetical protein